MEKQQQRKHLSFTSHQGLEQLQLQYLFVWGTLNILAYPPFLNRNFPTKHLLKAQLSNSPVQRKTLCMESVCSFFSFGSTTAELHYLTICGKQIPTPLSWDQEELLSLPRDAKPKPTQGNKSWSLTSAGFVSGHRNVSKLMQQVGGMVRSLSGISLVSVQCAKWNNILSASSLMLAQSKSTLIPGNVLDIQRVVMERDQRGMWV